MNVEKHVIHFVMSGEIYQTKGIPKECNFMRRGLILNKSVHLHGDNSGESIYPVQ